MDTFETNDEPSAKRGERGVPPPQPPLSRRAIGYARRARALLERGDRRPAPRPPRSIP